VRRAHLAWLLELGVELLFVVASSIVAMRFAQPLAAVGQDDRDVFGAVHRHGTDEPLLAQVSQVA